MDRTLDRLTFPRALTIGIAQALALFPGISRSGITISTGLFVGLTRESAARFSFLMATPITAGRRHLRGASSWSAARPVPRSSSVRSSSAWSPP